MGVPRTYVSKIENEKAIPTLSSLARLAAALEVTVPDLLVGCAPSREEEITELMADPFLAELVEFTSKLNAMQLSSVLTQVKDMVLHPRRTGLRNRQVSVLSPATDPFMREGMAARRISCARCWGCSTPPRPFYLWAVATAYPAPDALRSVAIGPSQDPRAHLVIELHLAIYVVRPCEVRIDCPAPEARNDAGKR